MTRHLDPGFDQRIADWLEADPVDAPREVLSTVLAAYPSIPQRRAWRTPWRLPSMNSASRLLAGGTVVAVVLAVGILAIGPRLGPGTGGPQTPSPAPTESPSTSGSLPSPTPNLGACRLLTSAEAADLAGDPGLGALPSQSGEGDVTSCLYSDGGGDTVLRVTQYRSGGSSATQAFAARAGVTSVADLGTQAVFDPATGELLVRSDDRAIVILAPKHRGEAGLPALREIAIVALLRL